MVSMALHLLILFFAYLKYSEPVEAPTESNVRMVQLVPRSPSISSYFEAPGAALPAPPSTDAPLSNANRRASAPQSTGDQRTPMPGAGGIYSPGQSSGAARSASNERAQQPSAPRAGDATEAPLTQAAVLSSALPIPSSKERGQPNGVSGATGVDWRSAIREAGNMASLGDSQNVSVSGGERGFADAGPISFETQWFEWGDYADSMVRKIRVNWYANMPPLIRMGMKGVVTVRFTILRNGRISDITVLDSSGVPPFDFAAQKAIELSSALAPLPQNFPNPQERVTAQFYYNLTPPSRASR